MDKAYFRRIKRKNKHSRVRKKIIGTPERPRLNVYRSLNHIYAQIIDDVNGKTLVASNSLMADVKNALSNVKDMKSKMAKSYIVGKMVAEKALKQGIKEVVFDRGGYKYHGRVAKLAEAAREAGLTF